MNDQPPHPDAERILHAHRRALEALDTGVYPLDYTMPDEATERAYAVARFYLARTQGDYYANQYGDVWE